MPLLSLVGDQFLDAEQAQEEGAQERAREGEAREGAVPDSPQSECQLTTVKTGLARRTGAYLLNAALNCDQCIPYMPYSVK